MTANAIHHEILDKVVSKDLSAKFALAARINELVDQRRLSQMEIANITSMTQPKVSQIRCYKLHNISLERLMQALVSLGQHVEIIVKPLDGNDSASITVHTP